MTLARSNGHQALIGGSGAMYKLPEGGADPILRLRYQYRELRERWGGLAPALVAIASMLDIADVAAREGLRPDIAKLLIEVSERLKAPPAAGAEVLFDDKRFGQDSGVTIDGLVRRLVMARLEANNWDRVATAASLGISRTTLWRYLTRWMVKRAR